MWKGISIFIALLCAFLGCATALNIRENPPDVFCKVIQEPHPLLMGTWECSFDRGVGTPDYDSNYVKYNLVKYEDKYALYFYRVWSKKKRDGWRDFIINGQDIIGTPEKFGLRIFVQGDDVYLTIRGLDGPVKMTRVDG
jgi:hypothetical protein